MVSKYARSEFPWVELWPGHWKRLERRGRPWLACSIPENPPDCADRDRPPPGGSQASSFATGENVAARPQTLDSRGDLWGYTSGRCSWVCILAALKAR